jgi:hypothetical protein
MAMPQWLEEARLMKKLARSNKSSEVFLQPIFEGKVVTLRYDRLELNEKGMTDKRKRILRLSGVSRTLYTDTYKDWGGVDPKVLYVHGVIMKSRKNAKRKRFIAIYVCGENGKEYHNQILSMQLLFARNFLTPIAQSSWMPTEEVAVSSLKSRLKLLMNLRIKNIQGKSFSPELPAGMEVFDCMAGNKLPIKKKGRK